MADSALALVSGVLSGGFALAGVGLSNWTSATREKRAFGRETALELAGMERLVWGDSWVELNAHLQRQEARWSIAGLPPDLIRDFRTVSIACWQDQQTTRERSGGEHQGIATTLLDAREAVQEVARSELLRHGSRRWRRRQRRNAATLVRESVANRGA